MMVTFVSQCEKKALAKTRRVLDSFANRIGDNAWQTVITNEGLQAVKKLLRKTASKNTAVACHWMRGRSHSELVWVVGNRDRFNHQGIVPVNSTQKNIINSQWESDWKYLPLIKALTAMAALFHDFGKASLCFQEKLNPDNKQHKGDPLRHEWVSCLLLNAVVSAVQGQQSDIDWLTRLSNGEIDEAQLQQLAAEDRRTPLAQLPNSAALIAWLIVSHHRLPLPFDDSNWREVAAETLSTLLNRITQDWGYENRFDEAEFQSRLADCVTFPNGLPSQSRQWLKQIKKWAARTKDCLPLVEKCLDDGGWRVVLHHARLALMLGDHYYSSQDADQNWHNELSLYANTDHKTRQLKQKLDEHLVGVARHALRTAHLLPIFEHESPRVMDVPALRKKSPAAFNWQNKAVAKIRQWKLQLPTSSKDKLPGVFVVNMASTGRGKTFANAKVMRALADDGNSLRFVLALGLRTLTLQTGDEYRDRIGLDDSELAVMIGSKAVTELHKQSVQSQKAKDAEENEQAGSESREVLLDEEVHFDCDIPEEGLATVLTQERHKKFLYAPVLACTIDHLMAATETKRGGRYILPSLRLLSSDLVIDEVDDFDGGDLIAIGRLIHLAGMLGRKVMISSATIPPDLAQGYFNAYREGWCLHAKARDAGVTVGCVWIDEFRTDVISVTDATSEKSLQTYVSNHQQFIEKRVSNLKKQPTKRKGEFVTCEALCPGNESAAGGGNSGNQEDSKEDAYFGHIQQAILKQHQLHHSIYNQSETQVSFGVVRVANIPPCIALAEYLIGAEWPEDTQVKCMAYHSRQVLLLRSEQEKHLDQVLKRKEKPGEPPAAFSNSIIREHLDNSSAKHMIFILVCTPVEEVGRDHDFDWAVIEPSSFRSIIQLAGRVRRHRSEATEEPNIALMQFNLKAVKNGPGKRAYCRPGYEQKVLLQTHDLKALLDEKAIANSIDAIPRIQKPVQLHEKQKLADLEHYVTHCLLGPKDEQGPETLDGWLSQCWWLTALPQKLNPFRDGAASVKLFLVWHDKQLQFMEKDDKGHPVPREDRYGITQQPVADELHHRLWMSRNYQRLLEQFEDQYELTMRLASLKYGELNLPTYNNDMKQYEYSDQFGLKEIRS